MYAPYLGRLRQASFYGAGPLDGSLVLAGDDLTGCQW